jgi:hypothetical protein
LPFHAKWVSLSEHGATVGYGWCRHPQNMHCDSSVLKKQSQRPDKDCPSAWELRSVNNCYKTLKEHKTGCNGLTIQLLLGSLGVCIKQ